MIKAVHKQQDSCQLTITNGDEQYSFDLEFALAFGVFAKDADLSATGGDKYLAFGVSPTNEKVSADTMEKLLLRSMDVMIQSFAASGLSYSDMEERVRRSFFMSAARHIEKSNPGMSTSESVDQLFKELAR
jgi:hypothetical protein